MNGLLRRVKVIISALYWLLFVSWRDLLRPRARCMVLLYHSIRIEERDRFESQMHVLRKMARPLRLESLELPPESGLGVAVTFDDAFVSIRDNALDILKRLDIPATVFVPVACLGRKPGWPAGGDEDEELLTAEQLKALPADLISIASHSVTHPHMLELDDDTLKWELTHSREALERITGQPVRYFSCPYGEWSPHVHAAALDAGYQAVFTIAPVPLGQGGQSVVGRVCVEPTDGLLEFRLKILGAYRWMPMASRVKQALKALIVTPKGKKAAPRHVDSATKGAEFKCDACSRGCRQGKIQP